MYVKVGEVTCWFRAKTSELYTGINEQTVLT